MRFFKIFVFLVTAITGVQGQSLKWKFNSNAGITSTPLIHNNQLFFGNDNGQFFALDLNSGKENWKVQLSDSIAGSAAILMDLILINDRSGQLYALNSKTGKTIWSYQGEDHQKDIWDYYTSSPTVYKNKIYIGLNNELVCISEKGERIWSFKTKGLVHSKPSCSNGKIYFGSFDGKLYCLDEKDGQLLWAFKTVGERYFPDGAIQRDVLINNGTAYFGSRDYNVYAIHAQKGHGFWNFKEQGSWVVSNMVADSTTLYCGTSDTHRFYALDKNTGVLKWKLDLNMRVYGGPTIFKDQLFFGCFNGFLYAVDKDKGTINWKFQTDGSKKNYSEIFGSNGHFKDGFELYGANYKATDRKILTLGSILGTPVVDNNHLYFGSKDGNLYALELE